MGLQLPSETSLVDHDGRFQTHPCGVEARPNTLGQQDRLLSDGLLLGLKRYWNGNRRVLRTPFRWTLVGLKQDTDERTPIGDDFQMDSCGVEASCPRRSPARSGPSFRWTLVGLKRASGSRERPVQVLSDAPLWG